LTIALVITASAVTGAAVLLMIETYLIAWGAW
jgi:hypothetical protein